MSTPGFPEHLRSLMPYVPGKPVEEVARELGLSDVVKLASNENPIGPSPLALAALRAAIENVHRYPDGSAFSLRGALGERLGVGSDRVLLGNGSNEIITLLARVLLQPGTEAVVSAGAFPIYALAIQANGATARVVPMRGFDFDLAAMGDAITDRTRIVFLGNPNNPTGRIYRRKDWEALVARIPEHVVVLCDDAYAEYVEDPEYPNSIQTPDRHPNLVVLRTFSKIYGLAGLRVGYGIGPRAIVDMVDRVRDPFNVNQLAQRAALAALDDVAHVERSVAVNRAGLSFLTRVCRALGLACVESHANFVLVDVGDPAAVAGALQQAGVIVRPVGPAFPAHVRVSVGLPDENSRFAEALAAFLGKSGTSAATLTQPPVQEAGS